MPLEHSSSPAAFRRNVGTLVGEVGRSPHVKSRAQALAISYDIQRRAKHRAFGGGLDAPFNPMQQTMPSMPGGLAPMGVAGAMPTAAPMMGPAPSQPMQGSQQQMPMASGVAAPPLMPAPNNPMMRPLMASGGAVDRASGGINVLKGPHLSPSWETRGAARQLMHGPILSAVPGRTDNHQAKVPSSSYVLPAAHIASMGHGNSVAGLSLANQMFGGPWGTSPMKMGHGSLPRAPRASGGHVAGHDPDFPPVDVNLSGSEFVIHPRAIIHKFGSIKRGHKILDHWVMSLRAKEIKTLKNLPPPAKD